MAKKKLPKIELGVFSMAKKKVFTTNAEILLFVKPFPGAESNHCLPAGIELEATGEPVERFSKGANESSFVFLPVSVKLDKVTVTGWVLANRVDEVDAVGPAE